MPVEVHSERGPIMNQDPQGLARSHDRYRVIPRVLCFIRHGDDVLLLRGAPDKRLWAGLYNGVGGHVERYESIHAALLREVREETGLAVRDVKLCGVVHADGGDRAVGILFFVFTAWAAQRAVIATSEGALEWIPTARLPPAEQMVEDLPWLLTKTLALGPADPPFYAAYRYDDEGRLMVSEDGAT
jgi:8-oxo-dGTP diphosphatase